MWLELSQNLKNRDYQWKFKLAICSPIFVILVALDWISKAIVVAKMEQDGSPITIIKNFLDFKFIINMGSAGGANADKLALTITLATISAIVLIIAFIFLTDRKVLIGITIILSGAIGNLVARAWAPPNLMGQYGGVVDFISVASWLQLPWAKNAIFNLADIWVNIGVIWFIIAIIIEGTKQLKVYMKAKKNSQSEKETGV
ncbi:lipoprotein signal peptidase [Mesoplasma syrphidae]|uniref:Lipoprotein signal peptidase n=1 Tax=Mesoplasma syrphidae TaxID=225999 RepID=A0A2K9C1X9_9MOLU|nr:signal peptidase II [Mesoplasma syrphidae]AUF83479.1 lipoprotein signal peptidase [Mesoplasma syrphidae]